MDEKERELHGIIRSYTENSMRTLNREMLAGLKEDDFFQSGIASIKRKSELAEHLFALEIHLLLWYAKYKVWIMDHPEHALVYMEDENEHGLGFPSAREIEVNRALVKIPGVDEEVKTTVAESRAKWK